MAAEALALADEDVPWMVGCQPELLDLDVLHGCSVAGPCLHGLFPQIRLVCTVTEIDWDALTDETEHTDRDGEEPDEAMIIDVD